MLPERCVRRHVLRRPVLGVRRCPAIGRKLPCFKGVLHSTEPFLIYLLEQAWEPLLRFFPLPLRDRVCPAHVVVQRLANSSPSDRLAKALTMPGRVVKTIYILKYFNEEDLRHRVQLQLNRGEHRHSLARWIFFAD